MTGTRQRSRCGIGEQRLLFSIRRPRSSFGQYRLLVEVGQVWLAATLANLLLYLFQLIVGRGLGPRDYGLFGALFGIVYLSSGLANAVQFSVAKFVATAQAGGARSEAREIVAGSISLMLSVGAVFLVIFTVASPWIAEFLQSDSLMAVAVTGPVVLVTLLVPVTVGALQGSQRFQVFALTLIAFAASRLVFGVAALEMKIGAAGVLGAAGLASALTTLLGVIFVKPPLRATIRAFPPGAYKRVLLPAAIGTLAVMFPGSVDVFLVRHFFAPEEAGLYTGASVLGRIILFLPGAVSTVLFPKIAENEVQGKPHRGLLYKGLALTTLISGGACLFFVIFPGFSLSVLLGTEYAGAENLVPLYSVAMFMFSLSVVFIYYHLAVGQTAYFFVLLLHMAMWIALPYAFRESPIQVLLTLLGINVSLLAVSQALAHLRPVNGPSDKRSQGSGFPRSSASLGSPLVSVIIPAYNSAGTIRNTLESVMNQDYPNLEVLVVADGCRDGTADLVRKTCGDRVRVIEHEVNKGLAAAYITGLANTQGPVAMFLHSDCELEDASWISRAVVHLERPNVAWVTGYYETLIPQKTHAIDQAFAVLRGEMIQNRNHRAKLEAVPFSEGKCDLISREVLLSSGGVPLMLRRSGEDQLLSYAIRRRGWTILKDNDLKVRQHYSSSEPLALLLANLRKEVTHGATQAVINALYWRTILGDLLRPSFSVRKGYHPVLKAGAFGLTLGMLAYAGVERSITSHWPILGLWGALALYYLWKCRYSGVRVFSPLSFLIIALGFASYIPYGLGLVWGVLRFLLMKAKVYTKPI